MSTADLAEIARLQGQLKVYEEHVELYPHKCENESCQKFVTELRRMWGTARVHARGDADWMIKMKSRAEAAEAEVGRLERECPDCGSRVLEGAACLACSCIAEADALREKLERVTYAARLRQVEPRTILDGIRAALAGGE